MAGSKDVLPGGGGGDSDPLLPRAEGFFEYNRRPRRDTAWLVAYGVVFLAALAGGIFAFVNRNDNYGVLLKPESLSDPKLCPAPTTGGRRRLLVRAEGDDASWQADMFLGTALVLLGVSAAGAVLLGVVLLLLARHHPKFVVYSALMLQVTLPGVGGLAALFGGNIPGGVVLLVLAAILALCFWVWWDRIQLVVSLLGVAGRALSDNMGLLPLALGLQLLLGLLEVPLLLAALAALMNGKLAYNDARVDGGTAKRAGECVDADGEVVPCCAWQTEPWVGAYMSLAAIAMLWTLFLIGEVKVFVVAGAVGQWYFQPVSQHELNTRSETNKCGPSRVALSARHAAGPSLGSLAAGSAVLTLVSVIRSAARRAQRERNGGNALAALAAACLAALLALVEFLTRFATVRAALSGESFFAAGRNVTSLLKRNALDAFGVWWLPPMILQTFCAMLAVAWAIVVAAVGGSVWSGMPQGSGAATLMAVIAFLTAWAVLAFCAGLLLNVVDAVFVCFAMERDAHTCVHPEVHEVYSRLPTVGPIVENPGGEVVYGQPAAVASAPPPAQYPYVPPATRV